MTAPAELAITSRTDQGLGISVPLAKILSHLMVVDSAITHEWPLTNALVTTELREATNHLDGLVLPQTLITEELRLQIDQWRMEMAESIRVLIGEAREAGEDYDPKPAQESIRDVVRDTMTLLTHVDREITGIPNSDPGRMP